MKIMQDARGYGTTDLNDHAKEYRRQGKTPYVYGMRQVRPDSGEALTLRRLIWAHSEEAALRAVNGWNALQGGTAPILRVYWLEGAAPDAR